MKKLIYLLVYLFFISCQQQKTSSNKASLKERTGDSKSASSVNSDNVIINPSSISEIKQAYAFTIDKLQNKLLDSVSFKYNCYNERSGTITYFSEKGKLSMIRHIYNEHDHHSATEQYFLSNNAVFFAYLNKTSWSFEAGQAAEGATKDNITEERLYIVKEKPVLCLEKKYITRSHTSSNPQPEAVQNRQTDCKTIRPLLNDFDRLLAFRHSSNHECFEK